LQQDARPRGRGRHHRPARGPPPGHRRRPLPLPFPDEHGAPGPPRRGPQRRRRALRGRPHDKYRRRLKISAVTFQPRRLPVVVPSKEDTPCVPGCSTSSLQSPNPDKYPMNRKTYFIVGAAVVALALVLYFAYSRFPPAAGVAGTLAGGDTTLAGVERADRYRAPQIDAGDVVLDNANLQLILQDPDIVEALRSDTLRTALKGALTNEDLKATLTKAIMGPVVINNPAAHADLMNALQEVVMGPAALNNPTEGAALMNALTNVLSDDALR